MSGAALFEYVFQACALGPFERGRRPAPRLSPPAARPCNLAGAALAAQLCAGAFVRKLQLQLAAQLRENPPLPTTEQEPCAACCHRSCSRAAVARPQSSIRFRIARKATAWGSRAAAAPRVGGPACRSGQPRLPWPLQGIHRCYLPAPCQPWRARGPPREHAGHRRSGRCCAGPPRAWRGVRRPWLLCVGLESPRSGCNKPGCQGGAPRFIPSAQIGSHPQGLAR